MIKRTTMMMALAVALVGNGADGSRIGRVCVYGGTADFLAFVRMAADRGIRFEYFAEIDAMPLADATNTVFLIVPPYERSVCRLDEPSAATVAAMAASAVRGNRFYLENVGSVSGPMREFSGLVTFGSSVEPFGQRIVESDVGLLQTRKERFSPAVRHCHPLPWDRARIVASVSDAIGVNSVFIPASERLPLVAVSANGRCVAALTRLAPYDPHFMRPYVRWRAFYARVFAGLLGVSENEVQTAFSATWPDFQSVSGGTDVEAAVKKSLSWHEHSGILFAPDGTKGMREAVTSDDFGWREALRTDCNLMTGALFARAGQVFGRADWLRLGTNLADCMLARGNQTKDGFFRWFDKALAPEHSAFTTYATDHGRATLAMVNLYEATGERRFLDSAQKAADAFLRWQGDDGLTTVMFDLRGEEVPPKGHSTNPVCYYENIPALFKLARLTGQDRYSQAALRTVRTMAGKFPDFDISGSFYSANSIYGRFLLIAATAQRATEADFSESINGVLDFYEKNQHELGGISEIKIRLVVNEEAGVGIGDGSDHIADLLYCNNFSLAALSVLMKLPANRQKGIDMERASRIYTRLRDFLVGVQIASDDRKFDGAWMRAFDMDIGEYHGLNKDAGWGPYCIETGWTTGTITLVLLFDGNPESYF